ncbi:unnamed protein product [Effrenium voratum]|nr:unnamed protein product [Effrenium voratum]
MVLEHELSKDSALNLQVVVGLVNEATVQIIGSHRVALNKHLNTMAGSIPGGWDPSSVDKQAFVLLPEELSGAVQDMCHQDQRNSGPGLHEIDTTGLDLLMGGADSSSSEEEEDRHVEVYTDTHEEVLCRKARKGPDMDQEHTENKVEMPDFLQRLHRLAHDADEEVDRKMRLLAYEIRAVKWPPNAADSWKEVKSFAEKVREIPQLVDMLCATTRDENVSLVGAEMRVKRRLKHLKTKRRASMMGLPDRDDAGVTPPEEVVMLFGRDEGDEADPAGIEASQALSHQPSMLPRLISKGGYYGAKSEDGSSSSSSSSKEDPVSQPSGRLRKAKRGVLREGGWKPDSTQVGVGRSMAMLHRSVWGCSWAVLPPWQP